MYNMRIYILWFFQERHTQCGEAKARPKYINEYFAHLNTEKLASLAIVLLFADVALFLWTGQKFRQNKAEEGAVLAYVNAFAKWQGDSFIELILAFALWSALATDWLTDNSWKLCSKVSEYFYFETRIEQ